MNLSELPTPSLILDVDRVRQNASRMSERVHDRHVRLRPHVKTHKCVEVARLQTEGHSGGITVSTLAEARWFAAHGFTDITYAVPIEPGKFPAAIGLIRRGVSLSLLTDDFDIPPILNAAAARAGIIIPLFLKIDCGYHRCGIDPMSSVAIDIARRISRSSHVRFAGVLTHAGHSYHARSQEEVLEIARHERDIMKSFASLLRKDGIEVPTVSIGSTPTITIIDDLDGVDEVRPGNYIFFDTFQATLGSCCFADCALTVLAAVVHRERGRRQVVIDAGAIALSKDRGPAELDPECGYGRIVDVDGIDLNLRVHSVSQEHGIVFVTDEALWDRLSVGRRVRVVANHSCLTAAQHSHYHVLYGDQVIDRWEIARGW